MESASTGAAQRQWNLPNLLTYGRLVAVPLGPLVVLARGYERLSRHPRIRAEQLLRLAEDKAFEIDDAIRDLGYAPRSLADGVADEARMLGIAA